MSLARWTSATDYGPDPVDFRYGQLKSWKTGIRLARILPGSGNQGISIELIDAFVTGSGRIPYDALSYTWGDRAEPRNINCNGKRLQITQTLFEALHRFRDPYDAITVWVDQICICQDRIAERNQQVRLMDQIFRNARKVIVWLGNDYDDSKAGMQLAKQLLHISENNPGYRLTVADFESHGLPRRGHRRWSALSAILQRPWFWRTWVVQEVVLNPVVDVVLGSAILTWTELEAITRMLEESPAGTVWDFMHAIDASELPFTRMNRIRRRHQNIISTPTSPIDPEATLIEPSATSYSLSGTGIASNSGEDPELLDLLMMSRGLGATDPRDRIYAFLGLSRHDVVPDYSESPESIFNSFAQQTIGLVTTLAAERKANNGVVTSKDRAVWRAIVLISCAGRHNQSLNLQSWVPDWTVDLKSRPLILGSETGFNAGGEEIGLLDWSPDYGLQVCGKLLDVVLDAGIVDLQYAHGDELTTKHEDIGRWMEEARSIADARFIRTQGRKGGLDAFRALLKTLSLCPHGYYNAGTLRRRNSLFDESDDSENSLHNAFHTLAVGPTRGRVAFNTTTGYIGLGPRGIKDGDLVFIIMGVHVPWILRPYEDAFELIGEAYVQGVMSGEGMRVEQSPVVDIRIR